MTTLLTIVRFSMAITANAIEEATDAQDGFNTMIHEGFSGLAGTLTFVPLAITGESPPPTFPINPSHAITISTENPDIIAFSPPTASGGGG